MDGANPRSSAAIGRHVEGLDGMRAVGMAAMMLFHAQLTAKGAFLALSQFFTLSGFLIVALLIRRLERDRHVDLKEFWGRRYRRLMPASLATLAGILVFGATIATEQQVDAVRRGVIAAVAQVVNWQFVFTDVSYVEQFQSPSPIQHFWSLAVEEQFYLVVPVVMIVTFRLTSSLRAVTAVFAALATASTVLMFVLFETGSSIDRLYYGTDTRASEMLVGGLLALALHQRPPQLSDRARTAIGWAGLAAYAVSVWAFFSLSLTDARMYRGGLFVYSVLTCIVIFSLVVDAGPLGRAVGWRPIAATGRITYGIYLIHWPLILTLTEERVGFGGWPLFLAVQAPVIVVIAALSAKFFEQPIRYARAAPGDRRFPIAVLGSGVILLVGALALTYREVDTDLAGLGEDIGEAPVVDDDGVLDAVLIVDEQGAEFAAELAGVADDTFTIAATLPFECELDDPGTGCRSWPEEWAGLIERHDPDVVLLHVSEWDVATLAGPADPTDWARGALGSGFDLLTTRGATVAWGLAAADLETAIRNRTDPFHVAMAALGQERPDIRRLGTMTDPAVAAADLQLYRRKSSEAPRVLVVGDSVSRTLGYGLERWGDSTGEAIVWSAGTEGCGIARGGLVRDASGREVELDPACQSVADGWAEQVRVFDPDIVVVLVAAPDFQERRLDGWDVALEPGDELFDDYLVAEYTDAADVLSAGGATVVWVESPCAADAFGRFTEPDGGNALDEERILHVNDVVLARLREERPAVTTFDLHAILCPTEGWLTEVDGVGVLRGDGVHFTPEGSIWLAETHGEELLAAAYALTP